MLVRDIYIEKYKWDVRIYYSVDCYYTDVIIEELMSMGCPTNILDEAFINMDACSMNTGFTYSDKKRRKSLVIIGMASSAEEFFNSFTHEQRHLVNDIGLTFNEDLSGEALAYLTGDISKLLHEDIIHFICHDRGKDCSCSLGRI